MTLYWLFIIIIIILILLFYTTFLYLNLYLKISRIILFYQQMTTT